MYLSIFNERLISILSIFEFFFNEIKNQFEKIIKISLSDNAKEYTTYALFILTRNLSSVHMSMHTIIKWNSKNKKDRPS